jgi:hypothetical protein
MEETERFAYQVRLIEDPMGHALPRLATVGGGSGQDGSSPICGFGHQPTGFDGDAQRLFAEDVQTRFHTINGNAVMKTVRQTQIHGIDGASSDQGLVVGVDSRAQAEKLFKQIRRFLGSRLVGVADRRDTKIPAAAFVQILHRQHMMTGNATTADQR